MKERAVRPAALIWQSRCHTETRAESRTSVRHATILRESSFSAVPWPGSSTGYRSRRLSPTRFPYTARGDISWSWSLAVAVTVWRCGLRLRSTRPADLAWVRGSGHLLSVPAGMPRLSEWVPPTDGFDGTRYAPDAFLGSAVSVLLVSLFLPIWANWIEFLQPGLRSRPYASRFGRRRADVYRFVPSGVGGDWEITGRSPEAGPPSSAAAVAVVPAGPPAGRGTEAATADTDLP